VHFSPWKLCVFENHCEKIIFVKKISGEKGEDQNNYKIMMKKIIVPKNNRIKEKMKNKKKEIN